MYRKLSDAFIKVGVPNAFRFVPPPRRSSENRSFSIFLFLFLNPLKTLSLYDDTGITMTSIKIITSRSDRYRSVSALIKKVEYYDLTCFREVVRRCIVPSCTTTSMSVPVQSRTWMCMPVSTLVWLRTFSFQLCKMKSAKKNWPDGSNSLMQVIGRKDDCRRIQ